MMEVQAQGQTSTQNFNFFLNEWKQPDSGEVKQIALAEMTESGERLGELKKGNTLPLQHFTCA